MTTREKIGKLQQAYWALLKAQVLVSEALGDSDAGIMFDQEIDKLIEDLDEDMIYLNDGIPV